MNNNSTTHLAMWCGPRNISTALMRAWENRSDTFVVDEPLYAHYLNETKLRHEMADEIINYYEDNWEKVVDWLTGPIPEEKTIFYQKHMCHHMLPNIRFEWLSNVTNCFLIRDPNEMLTSLMKKLPNPTLMDTGLPQQLQIFNYVRETTDETPPVIDSKDVLQNPSGILNALCNRLKIKFSELMLKWPPGIRKSDGIWAKHWYPEVKTTTGWKPFKAKDIKVPEKLETVLADCNKIYEQLYPHRIKVKS